MTLRYLCDALTNWDMKPLTMGAGHLWVLMSPWKMDVKSYMTCFIYWTIDLKTWNLLSVTPEFSSGCVINNIKFITLPPNKRTKQYRWIYHGTERQCPPHCGCSRVWFCVIYGLGSWRYLHYPEIENTHSSAFYDPLFSTVSLMFFNSTLNPILYCWKIKEVRRGVREIFSC